MHGGESYELAKSEQKHRQEQDRGRGRRPLGRRIRATTRGAASPVGCRPILRLTSKARRIRVAIRVRVGGANQSAPQPTSPPRYLNRASSSTPAIKHHSPPHKLKAKAKPPELVSLREKWRRRWLPLRSPLPRSSHRRPPRSRRRRPPSRSRLPRPRSPPRLRSPPLILPTPR